MDFVWYVRFPSGSVILIRGLEEDDELGWEVIPERLCQYLPDTIERVAVLDAFTASLLKIER